jgi:extracellular matrix regulatory protein A
LSSGDARDRATADRGDSERALRERPAAAKPTMVNIGYGNLVMAGRVIAIVSPGSSPMRRLRDEAGKRGKLLDATEGRRTRSIVLTDSDHVILSAITPETIATRLAPDFDGDLDQ